MSRWSRRSQEEKERIYRERVAQEEANERKKNGEHMSNFIKNMDNEIAGKIYELGYIPVACPNCGWVMLRKYELVNEPHVLAPKQIGTFLKGHCGECGKEIKRFVDMWAEEAIIMLATITILQKKGLLVDKRRQK